MKGGSVVEREEVFRVIEANNITSVAAQFVDFLGKLYTLWVSPSELPTGLEDGFGISGWPYFTDVEKSDILLKPDLSSFRILPWTREGRGYAGVMCDVCHPDTHEEIEESPRALLKRALRRVKEVVGKDVNILAVPECEFFLLVRSDGGEWRLHDNASYFSPPPADKGYEIRDDIVNALNTMGIHVTKHHHEDPRGKHELNIEHDVALNSADKIQFVKWIIRKVASENGVTATFMPKPFDWEYGAGWHTHVSLVDEVTGANLFYSDKAESGLSECCLFFLAGVLNHARALTAITNPTVNSYKRMIPGSQAPVYVAWSKYNRSALLRVPASSPQGTRFEYRPSDGACNIYLSLAALVHAGLDGLEKRELPPPEVSENIYQLTPEERTSRNIGTLPGSLHEALEALKRDATIMHALDPLTPKYIAWRSAEWREYSDKVYDWEREKYLEEEFPLEYLKHQ